MPHPNGGQGSTVAMPVTFQVAYARVGNQGLHFVSSTDEPMIARQGLAQDRRTPTISLRGQHHIHGRVCAACWGFSRSCTGERIGQASTPLAATVASGA